MVGTIPEYRVVTDPHAQAYVGVLKKNKKFRDYIKIINEDRPPNKKQLERPGS